RNDAEPDRVDVHARLRVVIAELTLSAARRCRAVRSHFTADSLVRNCNVPSFGQNLGETGLDARGRPTEMARTGTDNRVRSRRSEDTIWRTRRNHFSEDQLRAGSTGVPGGSGVGFTSTRPAVMRTRYV